MLKYSTPITIFLAFLFCELTGATEKSQNPNTESYQLLNLYSEILQKTQEHHITTPSMHQLIHHSIKGLFQGLDAHSEYLSAEEYNTLQTYVSGNLIGVGLELTKKGDSIIVVAPVEQSPAWHANIQPNDEIIKIDEEPTHGLSLEKVIQKLRGQPNDPVHITCVRPQEGPYEKILLREKVQLQDFKETFENGILALRIFNFNQFDLDQKILKSIKTKDIKKIKGIIIDLRNNSGGLVHTAVNLANIFLEASLIVSIKGKNNNILNEYHSDTISFVPQDIPIVILVNKGTASAAEIFTGALQDHKRAWVIGQTTFGKGTVQDIFPLKFDKGAVKITTGEYVTPLNKSIEVEKIQPNVSLPYDKDPKDWINFARSYIDFSTRIIEKNQKNA